MKKTIEQHFKESMFFQFRNKKTLLYVKINKLTGEVCSQITPFESIPFIEINK